MFVWNLCNSRWSNNNKLIYISDCINCDVSKITLTLLYLRFCPLFYMIFLIFVLISVEWFTFLFSTMVFNFFMSYFLVNIIRSSIYIVYHSSVPFVFTTLYNYEYSSTVNSFKCCLFRTSYYICLMYFLLLLSFGLYQFRIPKTPYSHTYATTFKMKVPFWNNNLRSWYKYTMTRSYNHFNPTLVGLISTEQCYRFSL